MANLIDGKLIAEEIRRKVRRQTAELRQHGWSVKLVCLMVGESAAGLVYSRSQAQRCSEVGIDYELVMLPDGASQQEVHAAIDRLNNDPAVNGIMLNQPLPDHLVASEVEYYIDPFKDVEGVNPANIGFVFYGRPILAPCTALAVLEILKLSGQKLQGLEVVIVGQGTIVGRPITLFLLQEEATVTACNKYTRELASRTRAADVLIVAVGHPGLITGEMVKPGAMIIDVGINRLSLPDGSSRTVGDVDFDSVAPVAGQLTPVPGGVGPVTVAILLRNTIEAARKQEKRH
ncbi:MAG: Bifunctional protein FolD protein [Phycisphaerae bacterium]|nr:Bifunctional protein FolD protein [Phycisphaerae bacterium]